MGWHGVSTKRITCWAPNQFCRFNQIRGSPVLNCWPVACDDLAMGLGFMSHVSKIGCVNIPGTARYPHAFHGFIPARASSFTMFHPWIFPPTMPLGHCMEPHPCSQEAFPISRFTISVLRSCLAKSKGVLPGNHS